MEIEPVVKELTVPVDPETAFRRFTAEVDAWWPRETHSVFQDRCAEVRMEGRPGGRVYEISDDGEEVEWGRLTAWEPAARVAFTWHPGREASTAQEVEVVFHAVDDGTRVRVEHRGWENLVEDAVETREAYDGGWNVVLGRYAKAVEEAAAETMS